MCRNHGEIVLKKGHECENYDNPDHISICSDCKSIENQRRIKAQEKKMSGLNRRSSTRTTELPPGRQRAPKMCRKCLLHGDEVPVTKHHKNCVYKLCDCDGCMDIDERRKGDRIKRSNILDIASDPASDFEMADLCAPNDQNQTEQLTELDVTFPVSDPILSDGNDSAYASMAIQLPQSNLISVTQSTSDVQFGDEIEYENLINSFNLNTFDGSSSSSFESADLDNYVPIQVIRCLLSVEYPLEDIIDLVEYINNDEVEMIEF